MATRRKEHRETCTERELKVVAALMENPDDLKGAVAAGGYKVDKSRAIIQQVINRPRVQKELARQRNARSRAIGVSKTDVLKQVAEIAMLDIGELVDEKNKLLPIKQLPARVRRALSHFDLVVQEGLIVGIKPMPTSKAKALELLMQHMDLLGKGAKDSTQPVRLDFNFNMPEAPKEAKARVIDGETFEIEIQG